MIARIPVQDVVAGVLLDGFGVQRCCLQIATFLELFIALIFQTELHHSVDHVASLLSTESCAAGGARMSGRLTQASLAELHSTWRLQKTLLDVMLKEFISDWEANDGPMAPGIRQAHPAYAS